MIAYLVALAAGLGLAIASRIVFWADLRQARRARTEPRIGLLAPALFIFTISAALVVVGFIGVLHEARSGAHSPVPLGVIWIVGAACLVSLLVTRHLRRRRARMSREQTRRPMPPPDEPGPSNEPGPSHLE